MSPPDRKPPAGMPPETREPKTIRFGPREWGRITQAALARRTEPSAFARECCLTGLMILCTPGLLEAHMRALAVLQAAGESFSA